MKSKLKNLIKLFLPQVVLDYLKYDLNNRELKNLLYSNIEINQKILFNQFRDTPLSLFNECGFRVHSDSEEDGLLLFIFSKIGFTNKRGVEMCAGAGYVCNLANLIIYHGLDGLLFDGFGYNIRMAKSFFRRHPNTKLIPPTIAHEWLTKENVNELLLKYGYTGEIDILSLDIDGNDYYLMKSINVVSPRVVICEINNVIPSNLSITMPYKSEFHRSFDHPLSDHRSVSLLGMVKLMKSKGYRLVGCHRHGFNLLFMRNDLGGNHFPEINYEKCFDNPNTKKRQKVWEKVKDQNWIEI